MIYFVVNGLRWLIFIDSTTTIFKKIDSMSTITILNNTVKTFYQIKKCNYGREKGIDSEKKEKMENYKFTNSQNYLSFEINIFL